MEQPYIPYIPYIPYMHTTPTHPAYTRSREERGMNIDKGRQALLKREVEIVWEEDPDDFDYVRERLDTYPNRRRIKKWRGAGRRVGYSVVALDAPSERGCGGRWASTAGSSLCWTTIATPSRAGAMGLSGVRSRA
jgi:hypothetical protein